MSAFNFNWFRQIDLSYPDIFPGAVRTLRDFFWVTIMYQISNYLDITITLLPSILKCTVPVNSMFFNSSEILP